MLNNDSDSLSQPSLNHNSYSLSRLPDDIQACFERFTKEVYSSLENPAIFEFNFESPVEGYKERKNLDGATTAHVWITPVASQNKKLYNPWQHNKDLQKIIRSAFEETDKVCTLCDVPNNQRFYAINYYPPNENFDASSPAFPYHTDFGYLACLISNGNTMILDPEDSEWKDVNMKNNQMIQVGGSLQAISNSKWTALPHGVGKSSTISGQFGKLSIVCLVDPIGPITLKSSTSELEIDSMEMIRIRFSGMWNKFNVETEESDRRIYDEFLAPLNNFPRP